MLRFIVLLGVLSLFGDMSWRIVCGVKRGEMGCVVDAERADAIALDCEFVDATGVLGNAPECGPRRGCRRMMSTAYLMEMTTISDQKISDTIPSTASGATVPPELEALRVTLTV